MPPRETPSEPATSAARRCSSGFTDALGDGGRPIARSSPASTCGSGCRPTPGSLPPRSPDTGSGPATSASCRSSTGCRRHSAAPWTPRWTAVLATAAGEPPATPDATIEQGVAGGETRFQVFARVARVGEPGRLLGRDAQGRHARRRRRSVASWVERVRRRRLARARGLGDVRRRPSSATPDCATCTCRVPSRAIRCARTSRCSPGRSSRGRASSTSSPCRSSDEPPPTAPPSGRRDW